MDNIANDPYHAYHVSRISSQISAFNESKTPFRIFHGTTNSTRPLHTSSPRVDISALNRIISISPDSSSPTVTVEPNVSMACLLSATLEHGLLPPVVMEFPSITCGGGFAGTSGESSSFRHGFFHDNVNKVEMVLGNGDVVYSSLDGEHADLFKGAAAGWGTVGVTTALELKLVSAKSGFVEVTYTATKGAGDTIDTLKQTIADDGVDYVDGIIYRQTSGVVVTARLLSNKPPPDTKIRRFTRAHDPWFYLHAQEQVPSTSPVTTEIVPVEDYLFRYDRGSFWTAKDAFAYFFTPFNFVTRYLLNPLFNSRVMYRALHASRYAEKYILQDVAIPYSSALEFSEFIHERLGIYPIWLCPLLTNSSWFTANDVEKTLLNFGVWGLPPNPGSISRKEFVDINRELEKKVDTLGGRKWLYAHAYYTEDEFWSIYDKASYERLREKYNAGYLPTVYDKVKVKHELDGGWFWSAWPVGGLYGLYKTIATSHYFDWASRWKAEEKTKVKVL